MAAEPSYYDVKLWLHADSRDRNEITMVVRATSEADAAEIVQEKYWDAAPRLQSVMRTS